MIRIEEIEVPAGLGATADVVVRALPEIAEALRGDIIAEARRELRTSGDDYMQNLFLAKYPVTASDLSRGPVTFAEITLVGFLANAIENGWEGGDMREWLLKGRNARTYADSTAKRHKVRGQYNVVGFRHMTPGTTGRNAQAMGTQYGPGSRHGTMSRTEAEQLGKAVYRKALALAKVTRKHAKGRTAWGSKLEKGVGGAGLLRPHHKSDIFAGMVRQKRTYRKSDQSTYHTFRSISTMSDPDAWIHPGIDGKHFFARAAKRLPGHVRLILGGAVRAHGGAK